MSGTARSSPAKRSTHSTGRPESPLACPACITDLTDTLDFVIVNAVARTAEALMPVARHVEGVVVLVTQNVTRRAAARAFVAGLRRSEANLLGVILTNPPSLDVSDKDRR